MSERICLFCDRKVIRKWWVFGPQLTCRGKEQRECRRRYFEWRRLHEIKHGRG